MNTPVGAPARIVVSRWGSTGDVLPYLAVGWELRRRGHDVSFVGNAAYATRAREAGLTFVAVGTEADHARLMADADVFDRRRKTPEQVYRDHYYPHLRAYYDATAAVCANEPRAIVIGGDAGAATAAEQFGATLVNIACSPAMSRFTQSRRDPPHPERVLPASARWFTRTGRRLSWLYALNQLRHRRPLAPAPAPAVLHVPPDHPIGQLRTAVGLPLAVRQPFMPRLVLCFWPEWLAAPQSDWPRDAVAVGFPFYPPLAGVTPSGTRGAMAPVVVTTGSLAGAQRRLYDTAIAACVALGRPAILVTPHRAQVPADLPPQVTYRPFAPFAELFAGAALVIHHGGIGTGSYALAAGIPQVVLPMRGDQFDNGNRFERLGVARMLPSTTSAVVLARTVRRLLTSPTVAARCRHWQQCVDNAGLARAAGAIERLVARERPSVPSPGAAAAAPMAV